MNKLATAMQEGEYDAERPPSKVGRGSSEGLLGLERQGLQSCCQWWEGWRGEGPGEQHPA